MGEGAQRERKFTSQAIREDITELGDDRGEAVAGRLCHEGAAHFLPDPSDVYHDGTAREWEGLAKANRPCQWPPSGLRGDCPPGGWAVVISRLASS